MSELETYDDLKAKAFAFVKAHQPKLRLAEADQIQLAYDLLGLLLETRDQGGREALNRVGLR